MTNWQLDFDIIEMNNQTENRRTVMMHEMRCIQVIETLGSRLRKLRNSKHLRQEQVANLIGVNKSAISYYENDTRQPSYATLVRLASIYNVTTDYLLGLRSEETFDTSGLTTSDILLVENMIQMLSDKNRRLSKYQEKYGELQEESKRK